MGFCSAAGLAKGFPSPPGSLPPRRPQQTTLLPQPRLSLFCLLVRLVFHLRSAPFRRENKHRNAGWQGDRRHEGKEQLRGRERRQPGSPLPGAGSSAPGRARQRWASGRALRGGGGGGAGGPSPVRVLRVRSSPRREADNSCSGSLGSLTPRWAR